MRRKIFISSSFGDYDLAQDLAKRLGKSGLQVEKVVALPEGASTREYVDALIREPLMAVSEVIIILTKSSMNNPWLSFEMGYATSLGKHITPLVQGIEPKELPELIRQMDYVRYVDLDKYISRLQRSLEEPSKTAA